MRGVHQWLRAAAGCVVVLASQGLAQNSLRVFPSDGEANVPLNARLMVAHGCCMATNSPLRLLRAGQAVRGETRLDRFGNWAVFEPEGALAARTTYTAEFQVSSLETHRWQFTTGDTVESSPPPTVVSDSQDVRRDGSGKQLQIRFSKRMNPVSLVGAVLIGLAGSTQFEEQCTLADDGRTLLVNTSEPPGRVFAVNFRSSPRPMDWTGNPLPPLQDLLISTFPQAPQEAVRLEASAPVASSSRVPTNTAIALRFSQPMSGIADNWPSYFSLIEEGGREVPLTPDPVDGVLGDRDSRVVVLRPAQQLSPDREYVVHSLPGFRDVFANALPPRELVRFRTGPQPELTRFQARRGPAPNEHYPQNGALRWVLSRPINRALGFSSTGGLPLRIADDGVSLDAFNLKPQVYAGTIRVFDQIESRHLDIGYVLRIEAGRDERPPVLLFTVPTAEGELPANGRLRAGFDEPLMAADARLYRDESPITGETIVESQYLEFRPSLPLTPGAAYRLEIARYEDFAGNIGQPVNARFTVSPPRFGALDLDLLRVEPADNSVDVDRRQPFVLEFSRPPDPYTLMTAIRPPGAFRPNDSNAKAWTVSGNTATYAPTTPWPRGAVLDWLVGRVTDWAGVPTIRVPTIRYIGRFATSAETLNPRVPRIASSPVRDGEMLEDSGPLRLSFPVTEPLNPKTVNASSVSVRRFGQESGSDVSYDPATQTIIVAANACDRPGEERFSVRFSSALQSLDGVPLDPFAVDFWCRTTRADPAAAATAPIILDTVPSKESAPTLDANSPIGVMFRPGTPRANIERGLFLSVNGSVVPFDTEWTPNDDGVTLWPKAPFPPGSTVSVLLSRLPWGQTTVESVEFKGPPPPAATLPSPSGGRLRAIRNSVAGLAVPTDSPIDIEFDREITAAELASARAFFFEGSTEQPRLGAEFRLTRLSARIVRLLAPTEMRPDTTALFQVRLGADPILVDSIRTGLGPGRRHSGEYFVMPGRESQPISLNSTIRVIFPAPVDRSNGDIRLELNGVRQAARLTWSSGNKIVALEQAGLLRPSAHYVVAVSGFRDYRGVAFRDRVETFGTGRSLDLVQPRITFVDPAVADASRVAPIRVSFDKPFALESPAEVQPFDWASIADTPVRGWAEYEDGGRTLKLVPNGPLPAFANLSLPSAIPGAATRAVMTGSSLSRPEPPRIEVTNPPPGSATVPPDVVLQIRFAEPVLRSRLAGVSVTADGRAVEVRPELDAHGRTLTLNVGRRVLPLSSAIVVRLADIANLDGVPLPVPISWSFTTAQALPAREPFSALVEPGAFKIRFSEALNPVTVASTGGCRLYRAGTLYALATRPVLEEGGTVMNCVSLAPLDQQMDYQLEVAAGVASWTGVLQGFSLWSWPVFGLAAPALDLDGPKLVNRRPGPGDVIDPTAELMLNFDEPVLARLGSVRLWEVDQEIPVRTSAQTGLERTIYIAPLNGWLAGRSYRVEVAAIADRLGNRMTESATWSFTSSGFPQVPAAPIRLVSFLPPLYSVGVEPSTPIRFEFSKPVGTVPGAGGRIDILYVPESLRPAFPQTTITGNTATVSNSGGWPPGIRLAVSTNFRDAHGNSALVGTDFTTAAPSDREAPRLEAVFPPEGNRLSVFRQGARIMFRFSEPVVNPTFWVTQQSLTFRARSVDVPAEGEGRTYFVTFGLVPGPSGIPATISVRDAMDLSGNLMPTVSVSYEIEPVDASIAPRVVEVSPPPGLPLELTAPITMLFSVPVADTLRAHVRLTQDGETVPFAVRSTDEGRTWIIQPNDPWRPAAKVRLQIPAGAGYAISGGEVEPFSAAWTVVQARVAPQGSPSLVSYLVGVDGVDLLFNAPLTSDPPEPFGLRSGYRRLGIVVRRLSDRWLRLVPAETLRVDGDYHLMLGPQLEIPLRTREALSAQPSESPGHPLPRPLHRFALASVSCRDANGRPVELFIPAGGGVEVSEYSLQDESSTGTFTCFDSGNEGGSEMRFELKSQGRR